MQIQNGNLVVEVEGSTMTVPLPEVATAAKVKAYLVPEAYRPGRLFVSVTVPGQPEDVPACSQDLVELLGKDYNAHRLAWLYMYGVWPEKLVDHINGRRDDNRIGNLRELSNTENQQNRRRAARHSSTGLIGVSQGRREGTFRAHITLNRERQFLGHFSDPLQAQQAYINAKRCLHPFGTI